MSSDAVIRLDQVTKQYKLFERPLDRLLDMLPFGKPRAQIFTALDNVSLSVIKGDVVGVVGQNGAGKSTLLQLICKTLSPTQGDVFVSGRVAALLDLGTGFNPEFTGRENVFLSGAIMGLSQTELEQKYPEIVAFAELAEFMDQPVKTYSSGMYVRLAFAIATTVDPDILVIDEALSVGDGHFARRSFERIMDLKKRGTTIVFCSHSLYHVQAICNRAIWLDKGTLKDKGMPEKVAARYNDFLISKMTPATSQHRAAHAAAPAPGNSGTARFTELAAFIESRPNGELIAKSGLDTLVIRMKFRYDTRLPPPTAAVSIDTASGIVLTSAGSLYDRHKFREVAPGYGETDLVFKNIPLMKGRYSVNAYLLCENSVHVYDQAPNCFSFEVEQNRPEQGLVYLPREWV